MGTSSQLLHDSWWRKYILSTSVDSGISRLLALPKKSVSMSHGFARKAPVAYHCLNTSMDPIVNPH